MEFNIGDEVTPNIKRKYPPEFCGWQPNDDLGIQRVEGFTGGKVRFIKTSGCDRPHPEIKYALVER